MIGSPSLHYSRTIDQQLRCSSSLFGLQSFDVTLAWRRTSKSAKGIKKFRTSSKTPLQSCVPCAVGSSLDLFGSEETLVRSIFVHPAVMSEYTRMHIP